MTATETISETLGALSLSQTMDNVQHSAFIKGLPVT